jgi:Bax protein
MRRLSGIAAIALDGASARLQAANSYFAATAIALVVAGTAATSLVVDWPPSQRLGPAEVFVPMTEANTVRIEAPAAPPPMLADVSGQPSRPDTLHVNPGTTKTLMAALDSREFSLVAVRAGAPVPRIIVAAMPPDIGAIATVEGKRSAFIRSMLPLILAANERIEEERRYLVELKQRHEAGKALAPTDQAWLALLAQRYKTKPGDWAALLERVDIVPPSLAIAQSIVESGWGSSAPARRMNALFGMIGGDGTTTAVLASYRSAYDSVAAYTHNLNTLFAYGTFRKLRQQMRDDGRRPDGQALAGTLLRYSELGAEYTRHIQLVIQKEDLAAFDAARLVEQTPDG